MIQFNLLPDIKLQYIKARRNKRLVMLSAVMVAGTSLGILILLFLGVSVFQKKHMSDLSKDISTLSKKLQEVPDLNKALTVQNQLSSLETLHSQKPATTRFFNYVGQITPSNVTINAATIDFKANTITIGGNAADLNTVNKFVDTLKFTSFKAGDQPSQKAFSNVVLSSFTLPKDAAKAGYQINFEFAGTIFDITQSVALEVPKQTSTRSETEKPKLFEMAPDQTLPGSQ